MTKFVFKLKAIFGRPATNDLEKTIDKIMALLDVLKSQVAATEASEAAAVAALTGVGGDASALADRLKVSQEALDTAVAGASTT